MQGLYQSSEEFSLPQHKNQKYDSFDSIIDTTASHIQGIFENSHFEQGDIDFKRNFLEGFIHFQRSLASRVYVYTTSSQQEKYRLKKEIQALMMIEAQRLFKLREVFSLEEIRGLFEPLITLPLFTQGEKLQMRKILKTYFRELAYVEERFSYLDGLDGKKAKTELKKLFKVSIPGYDKREIYKYHFYGNIFLKVERGSIICIFSDERDYRSIMKEGDLNYTTRGTYHNSSKLKRAKRGCIISLNGSSESTQKHEQAHREDSFIEDSYKNISYPERPRSLDPFQTAQQEIIALMSEQNNFDDIYSYLSEEGENGYLLSEEDLKEHNLSQVQYKKKVYIYLEEAFSIKETYPTLFLHLLSATSIQNWHFLTKK